MHKVQQIYNIHSTAMQGTLLHKHYVLQQHRTILVLKKMAWCISVLLY